MLAACAVSPAWGQAPVTSGLPPIQTPTTQPVITQSPATATPSSNTNCLFTPQSSGAIEHLLYDGRRYHGIVKASNGLLYWLTYENDNRLSLKPCGVYGFTDLNSSEVVVDAAVNQGNRVYVAYHDRTDTARQLDAGRGSHAGAWEPEQARFNANQASIRLYFTR